METRTVQPAFAPSKDRRTRVFTLSTLDQVIDRNYTTFLHWFRLSRDADIFEVFDNLRRGMALTMIEIPLIAGRIKTVDKEKDLVQIEVSQRAGLPMTMRNLSSAHGGDSHKWRHGTMQEVERKGIPLAAMNDPLLRPPELQSPEGAPVMIVQVTFIDGGCVLYAAKSHAWCDGTAGMYMYQRWSKNTNLITQGLPTPSKELPAYSFDRLRMSTAPTMELPIPADADFGQDDEDSDTPVQEWIFSTWYISAQKIKELREYATPEDSKISYGDAINSLFWRSFNIATGLLEDEEKSSSKAAVAADFRRRLTPKIQEPYIGNASSVIQAEIDEEDGTARGREGLQTIARTLRQAVLDWDADAEVNNQIGLLHAAQHLSRKQLEGAMKLVAGPDILFADHSRIPMYSLDWGAALGMIFRLRELPQYGLARPAIPIINVYPFDLDGNAEIKTNLMPSTLKAMVADPELRRWIDLRDLGMDEAGSSTYGKARL